MGRCGRLRLTDEKIHRDLTPEKKAKIAQLDEQIAKKDAEIETKDAEYKKDVDVVRVLQSDQSDMEFKLNTLKANVGVLETNYQDSVTAGDTEAAAKKKQTLDSEHEKLANSLKDLEDKKNELAEARKKLGDKLAVLTGLKKDRTKLAGDAESLS